MSPKIKTVLFEKLAVSLGEASEAFGIGQYALRAGIERKEIPTTGFGRTLMIPTAFIRERLMLERVSATKEAA